MSVSATSSRWLQRLLPRPRRPRVGRSLRHHRWNPRRAAIGVEVCGTALHLAAVRPGWSRRWLTAAGVIPDFAQLDPAGLRDRIRQVLGPVASDDPLVVLGVPRREVIVRHLRLPLAAEKSLDSVLNLQLGLYKPSDDEDFCWDAAVTRGADHLDVSLMFAPRARVEEWTARLRDAGFPVARLTTAQFALLGWATRGRAHPEKLRLMLVQSRGSETDLAIVDGGSTATRSLAVAEDGAASAVGREARNVLAAQRAAGPEPRTVVIAGKTTAAWRESLQEFGDVQELAQYCDAWSLTETAAANYSPDEFWGAIALAIDGLAWSGSYRLNLLPPDLRPVSRRWRNVPMFTLLAVNILLLLALSLRGPVQRSLTLRRYDAEIERVDRTASLVERELRKEQRIEDRLSTLRDFQLRGRRPLDALGEIAQKLPSDAWVSIYSCKQNQVDISGTAKSASTVLPALKASSQFQEVQYTGGFTKEPDGGERFRIQMKLKEQP